MHRFRAGRARAGRWKPAYAAARCEAAAPAFLGGGRSRWRRAIKRLARTQLTRSLELDPVDEQSALALSSILIDANDAPGARAVLEKTLSAAGNAPRLAGQLAGVPMQMQQCRRRPCRTS
ncbi:MAG: hypothetical protein IPJ24_16635, partial [bacterium]|nr:hypothetical protein [bacterium]